MNQDIQDKVNIIAGAFQPVIDAANAIPALVDAQELVKYNEGVEAGKAMIQLPDPTDPTAIYSQAQMDAAVSAGKEQQASEDKVAFDAQGADLAALKQQIADLQGVADAAVAKYSNLAERVKQANVDDAALIAEL